MRVPGCVWVTSSLKVEDSLRSLVAPLTFSFSNFSLMKSIFLLASVAAAASNDCGNGNACLQSQTCVPSHISSNSTGVITGTLFGKRSC